MPFIDRVDAGRKLAAALARFRKEDPVILALVRGGLVVAAEIASAFQAPLDIVLVRKIGVPCEPELAMGAVVDGRDPVVVRNEAVIRAARVSKAEFEIVVARELGEIDRRRDAYLRDRERVDLRGRNIIVVDDGIATGATTRAVLSSLRQRGARKLVLAIPVAPKELLDEMTADADEIVCLEAVTDFGGVGAFYQDFHQVSDDEVEAILDKYLPRGPSSHTSGE